MALARERERQEETKRQAITTEALTCEAEEEAREIGFSARLLVQATLPHSKPDPALIEFKRTNGHVTVRIVADSDYGLPYGTYPRLLLAWVTTEAVRTKSPELELGDSLRQFMSRLGMEYGGGPRGAGPRLRQHMQRLFSATMSATYPSKGEWHRVNVLPVVRTHIFWDPKRPNQMSLWKSTIKLSQEFFEEITHRPVPIDMHALKTLAKSRSPLAIDIYQWLTYRMSYLRESTTITWEGLQGQLGVSQKVPMKAFKPKFLRHLKQVIELYPQARVEPGSSGLKLLPSRPHVPMRLLPGRRA
jgi:hypothetical protein